VSCSVCVDNPFYHAILKYITLAIENYESFATFLNNMDALNLTGAINRSVGKSDGLLSAYATVSVKWI
jgi:hypothetical protein